VKQVIRKLAWHLAPQAMADRANRWNQHVREREGVTEAAIAYVRENGATVSSGPFTGLSYPIERIREIDAPIAKLTGTYESDLHPVISEALVRKPRVFVDIGAADGYYAVGFAKASGVETHGFELSPRARQLCAEVSHLNGASISLHGGATSSRLRSLPLTNGFVLSDCEGAEADIFDKRVIAALHSTLVVIEVHEWACAGVEALLAERFDASHDAELVTGSLPERSRFDEGRWLIFRPR
jgi:hypothetical protein